MKPATLFILAAIILVLLIIVLAILAIIRYSFDEKNKIVRPRFSYQVIEVIISGGSAIVVAALILGIIRTFPQSDFTNLSMPVLILAGLGVGFLAIAPYEILKTIVEGVYALIERKSACKTLIKHGISKEEIYKASRVDDPMKLEVFIYSTWDDD